MLDLKKLFDKILTSISSLQTNKVNKTGDTMTSNLSLKASNIDASKADNNVSSVQYPTTFNILDTSNRIITRQEAVVNQNGNIGGYWYVRNYDTSGTQVAQKGIKMDMNKSGALTYTVSDSDNFRTAINAVNWQTIYPVGCYFETSDTTFDPNIAFGGTWVLETEGQVHISAGQNYIVGDTGGEATHTLTVNEMPSHTHTMLYAGGSAVNWGYNYASSGGTRSAQTEASGGVGLTGGGQAHNNMQPYIVVNRWHRTA